MNKEKDQVFTLENKNGTKVNISNYGGIVKDFIFNGRNVILGKDKISDYRDGDAYIGALIGRVGNRIGNGQFTIEGETYHIPKNDGSNSLHGGEIGFDSKYWDVRKANENELILSLLSENNDQGYPGNLEVIAKYTLDDNDNLILEFEAETDKTTPVNLTSHMYFNLDESDTIKDHYLKINTKNITENDENSLPTGIIEDVTGTALDFSNKKLIREALEQLEDRNIQIGNGVDHNFIIKDVNDEILNELVQLQGKDLLLTVYSDQPGVQVYTGNFLDENGRNNVYYSKNSGVAIEPQNWPDAINKNNFPNALLNPGEKYNKKIIYHIEEI